MVTALSAIIINDTNKYFFIVFGVLIKRVSFFCGGDQSFEDHHRHMVDEYASGGVLGFGSHMYADAVPFGYIEDLR